MKSVLFKEKLLSALDFAQQHHESCKFATVTIGLLRHVFFVEPVKVAFPGSDDYCFVVRVRTYLVATSYNDSNVFEKDDKLIAIQTASIPMTQASSVFDILSQLSIVFDYED